MNAGPPEPSDQHAGAAPEQASPPEEPTLRLTRERPAVPPLPDATGRLRPPEPSAALPFVFAGHSDPGRRRETNQDRFVAERMQGRQGDAVLLVVADGMGGTAGGETASREAVAALLDVLGQAAVSGRTGAEGALSAGIGAANRRVFERAQAEPALRGMGTTLVAVLVEGRRAVVAHVGDSRAYLIRDGTLHQLTADHSWVAEQVRMGDLTAAEAEQSSYRHVLTRAVGVGPDVQSEVSEPLQLTPGDVLVLCSDGLHGVVDDATIAAVARDAEPDAAARRLVVLANERGGPDNVTVVVGRLGTAPAASPDTTLTLADAPATTATFASPRDAGARSVRTAAPAERMAPAQAGGRSRGRLLVVAGGAAALVAVLVLAGAFALRSGNSPKNGPAVPAAAVATTPALPAAAPARSSVVPAASATATGAAAAPPAAGLPATAPASAPARATTATATATAQPNSIASAIESAVRGGRAPTPSTRGNGSNPLQPDTNLPACETGNSLPCAYTAKAGDTVSGISDQFNVPQACFQAINILHNPISPASPANHIGVGETYTIPAPSSCTTSNNSVVIISTPQPSGSGR